MAPLSRRSTPLFAVTPDIVQNIQQIRRLKFLTDEGSNPFNASLPLTIAPTPTAALQPPINVGQSTTLSFQFGVMQCFFTNRKQLRTSGNVSFVTPSERSQRIDIGAIGAVVLPWRRVRFILHNL